MNLVSTVMEKSVLSQNFLSRLNLLLYSTECGYCMLIPLDAALAEAGEVKQLRSRIFEKDSAVFVTDYLLQWDF
jgi:hypothetical protein